MHTSHFIALAFATLAAAVPARLAVLYPSSEYAGTPTYIQSVGCHNIPEEDDAWYNVHSYIIQPLVECEFFKGEDCSRSAGKHRGEEPKFITSNIQSVACRRV